MAALQTGVAFLALLSIPREGAGFSLSRLALLGTLLLFFLAWVYLLWRGRDDLNWFAHPGRIALAAFLSWSSGVALFLLRYLDPARLLPIYVRLTPLLGYLSLLALELCWLALARRCGMHPSRLRERGAVFRSALLAWAALLLALLVVSLTRLGLKPDAAYWAEPGVPVLGWQLGLALTGGLCLVWLSARESRLPLDVLLPPLVWLLGVGLWLSVPMSVMQSSFYAPMSAPQNVPFPNSDAAYYDSMAHSLLIGYPYQGEIPTRPLYIVFLAALHSLAGERYDLILAGQTLLLAFIPVALYLLGQRLHSRAAGLIVALLAIFREWVSLWISSQTRVSNTRTLLVDLPTLLLLLLACLLVLAWLQRRDEKSALLAGGVFGLLLLLRTQSILILLVILPLAILILGWRRSTLRLVAFFLSGLLASVIPWLFHNYLRTGAFAFDAPFQYRLLASQYQYTGNLDISGVDLQGKSLAGVLVAFVWRDPAFVFGFIATHFLATQINALLALPLIEPYDGLFAPIRLYWMNWDGSLSSGNFLLLLLYLAVIALGLGAVWQRLGWAGLTPLAFSIGYSLANGIGRFSGWRYDLPADWVWYFYFGIGAAEAFAVAALWFGALPERVLPAPAGSGAHRLRTAPLLLMLVALALLGGLPWMAEGLASPRYAGQTPERLLAMLAASNTVQQQGVTPSELIEFSKQPQAVLQIGRVLYPRFFVRDRGLSSSNPWPAYTPRPFSRMGFVLINQARWEALLPSRQMPLPFPHAADAIVLGCQREGYVEARLVFFPGEEAAHLSAPLSLPCSREAIP